MPDGRALHVRVHLLPRGLGYLGSCPVEWEGGLMAERPPWRVAAMAAMCAVGLPISSPPAAAQALDASPSTAPSDDSSPPPPQPETPMPQMQPLGTEPANLPYLKQPRATGDWFGLRRNLEDAGVMVNARLVADYSKVFQGGASPAGTAFRDLFQLNLTLDAGKLVGLQGGTVFANFQNQAGDNGSKDVGDLQGFDSIDADGRTQLSELWYQQALFDQKLLIKLGKIDPNSVFALPVNGGEFVHSGGGISPNILIPQYPDPATGAQAVFAPTEHLYLGGGVFDGSFQDGIRPGSYGPAHFFGKPPNSLSLVGETGFKWGTGTGELPGRLALGAWHDTATFQRFDGTTQHGASGYYLVLDNTFWRANPKDDNDARGITGYLQYAYADPHITPLWQHVGGGLTWTGPLPFRADDALGVGANYARLSNDAPGLTATFELAIELFYRIQVTPFLSIKPDLQYIINPGGIHGQGDALVGTVRLQVEF
jgi:porin